MSDELNAESEAIRNRFLKRLLADSDAGRELSVERYQADFPGHEALVAEEFAAVVGGDVSDRFSAGEHATTTHDVVELVDLLEPSTAGRPGADSLAAAGLPPRIGPYRLIEIVGEGGMGIVVRAAQTGEVEREVAVKVIKPGMDSRDVLARFEGERRALGLMSHSNIARVFDAGALGSGRPYFVMEYVSGASILEHCDAHRLDLRARLELFLQVCAGVAHAHEKGIVHRDLKGSNVLVAMESGRAVPKIIDFGIAKSLSRAFTEHTVFTELGQLIGTPAYMAPEQAALRPERVDARADVYSLGAMLYELITGSPPLDGLKGCAFDELRRRVLEETPPRPVSRLLAVGSLGEDIAARRGVSRANLLREVRGDLGWVVMKALEKDRIDRYATVADLAQEVRSYLQNKPVKARRRASAYLLQRFVRRRRVELGVAAVVAVLLVIASFIAGSIERSRRQDEARLAFRDAEAALADWGDPAADVQALSRSLATAERSSAPWKPIWDPDRREELRLREARDDAKRRLWSGPVAARAAFARARDLATRGSELRSRATERLLEIERGYLSRARLWNGLDLDPSYFQTNVQLMNPDDAALRAEPVRFTLRTEPSGADVYFFRYVEIEERLVPLPIDPDEPGTTIHEPFLVVERRWDELAEFGVLDDERRVAFMPFSVGDRLLSVDGHAVRTRSDLAERLRGMEADQTVKIVVRGDSGQHATHSWRPFPVELYESENAPLQDRSGRLRPGGLIDIRRQLGVTFQGYPLYFDEERGRRPIAMGGLAVDLSPGSYLLVIRKTLANGEPDPEFPDVRFPVASPWSADDITVRIPGADEIPAGFIFVPGGPFQCGGDREVDQSLEPGTVHVSDFFIKRLEVTVEEYLEFLNDPKNGLGKIERGDAEMVATWRHLKPGEKSVEVIPRVSGVMYFEREADRWVLNDEISTVFRARVTPRHAVLGLSMLAGLEYARWFQARHGADRWRFGLPDDLFWEKAARGVDRRTCVWGRRVIPAFCDSFQGDYRDKRPPDPVAAYPLDESVYGVRDLAGSAEEPTSVLSAPGFSSYRGGGAWIGSDYWFRAANRNGRAPDRSQPNGGLRLVAWKVE